ncbi:Pimeloyl-ACP methyl ester carboxylesterase [Friedmanniella luteola]|uniref:Pimeloyl-ACP methyl ester carboxylesterase n=1 Tax=Friedmanniella luteola TaxID=546871 RepID=A0A1H1PLA3_9ACTN|nr:alpha/beta hydrolase [Friedmanniella luteola]SDS11884.1 Pimeloyl-ACP methyl ester carboxylesterase [Friedmanniella luteola]
MSTEHEVDGPDGYRLRVRDAGGPDGAPVVLWQHGSPHSGALVPPLVEACAAAGLRLVSYARPGYGGSTGRPGRDVAAAAADVTAVLDALRVEHAGVVGSSGGGPHSLACAALLPDRVTAAVCLASPAPYDGTDAWFAGMASDDALRAAVEGRAARVALVGREDFDPAVFTATDWAALEGRWATLGADAGAAGEAWPDGLVDDDVALVTPWGFRPGQVEVPVLLVHGGADRMIPVDHAHRLLAACPRAELWLRPRDGHVSVLDALPVALAWLTPQLR